jgi:hypothetical protein
VVLGDRPVARQHADDALLIVHTGQALVDEAVYVAGAVNRLEERVEDAGGADQRLDGRAAPCRLRHRRDRLAPREGQSHRRNCGGEQPPT